MPTRVNPERIKKLFDAFNGRRVVVVGDLMLDRYVWGKVSRISPEAPVPVLEIESESARLGGAANVANNIKSLGADAVLFGVVGKDSSGEKLRALVAELGLSTEGIVTDESRPTTVKTRVIAHGQHVVRMDSEVKTDINRRVASKFMSLLESQANGIDAILLEDYNKGMLGKAFLSDILGFGRKKKKVICVDPKQANFFEFKRVTVFKPNRKEAEMALGRNIVSDEQAVDAASELLRKLRCEHVLLTRGDRGMTLLKKGGDFLHLPTKAREVADVSGAGDTVISTLTVALVAGADIFEAAAIANHAGGIVCGEVGIAPVDKKRLLQEVIDDSVPYAATNNVGVTK